jgi:hypothetical protein
MRLPRLTLWAFLPALFLMGCGSPDTAQVAGKVTLDGQPLQEGAIQFYPVDGASPTAGGPIRAGEYAVTAAPVRMQVKITGVKAVGKRRTFDSPSSPTVDVYAQIVPARYNEQSELVRDLQTGDNSLDFDLKSK